MVKRLFYNLMEKIGVSNVDSLYMNLVKEEYPVITLYKKRRLGFLSEMC